MSQSTKSSSATKQQNTQAKQIQQKPARSAEQATTLGLSNEQMAAQNHSLANPLASLDRLHPAQRAGMMQRMLQTHSNSQIGRMISRSKAESPSSKTKASDPSQFQLALTEVGLKREQFKSASFSHTNESQISREESSEESQETTAQTLEEVIRSMLENQCPADPSPLLTAIQDASLKERQDVLTDPTLLEMFNMSLGDLATVYISALLEGSQTWENPPNNDFFNYFYTGVGSPPSSGTSMNCWESILYAAYLAGEIDSDWIKNFYTDALASPDPNAQIWQTLGFSTSLSTYPKEKPQSGDLVFYYPSGATVPSHVALSIGNDEAMSLWSQPNNIDEVQQIDINDLAPKGTQVFFNAPPW